MDSNSLPSPTTQHEGGMMNSKNFYISIAFVVILVLAYFWIYPSLGTKYEEGWRHSNVILGNDNNIDIKSSDASSFSPSPSPSPSNTPQNTTIHQPLQPPKDKWVWLWSESTTYLWTQIAYIDTRTNVYKDGPVVIAMVYREKRPAQVKKGFTWYCHLRSLNRPDTCTGQTKLDLKVEGIGYKFHSFSTAAYFICPIPSSIPLEELLGVAFSPKKCNSTNISPFVPIKQKETTVSKQLGLCIHKALFELDDVQALVEYIELHRLLGVELFTIYIQDVSKKVSDVLEVYSREGLVDLVYWNIPISTKVIRDFGQVGVIHECLLRNQYRVKYLGFSDFDEVFVPLKDSSLLSLLSKIDRSNYGSFRFLHVFVHKNDQTPPTKKTEALQCPEVRYPLYFKWYKHSDYRDSYAYAGDTLGSKAKVIVKPQGIVRMSRHSMHLRDTDKFAPGFKELTVPGDQGLLFHYRRKIQTGLEKRPPVDDKTLWKYNNQLIKQLNQRLCKEP